ncbi:hypothetical protein L7F22_045240 [Adiantum nelumboides]|nr:hypothetical protein [Adiantum nelumboides]
MGGEKRHEMMETLFGAESDTDDDEALERLAARYSDDEVEGGGQMDAESEGERAGSEHDREESEAERVESEAEREESDAEHSYDGEELNQQRRSVIADRRGLRQQVSASGSEQSQEAGQTRREEDDEVDQYRGDQNAEEGDEEVEQAREQSDEGDDSKGADGVAGMRDVFGDSDEEEQEAENLRHPSQAPEEMSASDDEASVQKGIRPEDIVPDAEQHEERFESDDEQPAEHRPREKPVGPPLQIYLPLCPPPGPADKMHIVRVSNIMGIESKPFDPKTYIEEEEQFITDETGHKQRLRLEDNVARWRKVRDRDGNYKYESNARFVKWSDGSMQLLIGNEVLDISIQKAHQDQGHLFVRHDKVVLVGGRLGKDFSNTRYFEPYGCQMHWELCPTVRIQFWNGLGLKTGEKPEISASCNCSFWVGIRGFLSVESSSSVGNCLGMDGYKEEGSSSQDRQSNPTVHEVGEGSSQAEEGFPHAAFSITGTASRGTLFGGMQSMLPNTMYANIGLHPGFQGTQDGSDVLHTDPDQVLGIATDFYEDLFTVEIVTVEILKVREQIWSATHSRVTDDMRYQLMAPFTIDELHDAVHSLAPSPCPGDGGLTRGFFVTHWDILHMWLLRGCQDMLS